MRSGDTITARIFELLEREDLPDFLCLRGSTGGWERHGYHAVIERALGYAQLYADLGLVPGDRVGVILPHSLAPYCAYVGAVLAGMVPAMFHFPSIKLPESVYLETIGELVDRADLRLVVTWPELIGLVARCVAARGGRALVIDGSTPPPTTDDRPRREPDPADLAFIQFSSGTTGRKKGVMISHRALLAQVDAYGARVLQDPSPRRHPARRDRIASWAPLYHDLGLVACLWMPMLTQTPIFAMSPFDWVADPLLLLEAISEHRATLTWLPNFAFHHLCRAHRPERCAGLDLSSMRGLIDCAEPILAETFDEFLACFGAIGARRRMLWTTYGMAESTLFATACSDQPGARVIEDLVDAEAFAERRVIPRLAAVAAPASPSPRLRRMVSSGTTLAGVELAIVDAAGNPLGERELGEILVRSPCAMDGYFRNPEQTEAAFVDGWYRSGDLGYVATMPDGEGGQARHLFVAGRLGDMLIVAGKNVYPQDLEPIVNRVEGVVPGRVAAVGEHSPRLGTEALVILAETTLVGEAELLGLQGRIARAIREHSEVTASEIALFPPRWLRKSSSGKIARKANLARLRADRGSLLAQGGEPPLCLPDGAETLDVEGVRRVLVAVLRPHDRPAALALGPRDPILTSQLVDSLTLVVLLAELEAAFGVRVPFERELDYDGYDSLAQIVATLGALRATPPRPAVDEDDDRGPLPSRITVHQRKTEDFLASTRDFDLLILGDSRVFMLPTAVAGPWRLRAYNFGLSSAFAEDVYCVLRFVLEHNRRPLTRVILGLDCLSLTATRGVTRRLKECAPLAAHLMPPERDAPAEDELLEGDLSRRYQELMAFQRSRKGERRSYSFDRSTGDHVAFWDDAEQQACHRARAPWTLPEPRWSLASFPLRMNGFVELAPMRQRYLEATAALCSNHGIDLCCFELPMHQSLRRYAETRSCWPERRAELRRFFATALPHVPLYDFVDPASFGGHEGDFSDTLHVMPYNGAQLLRHLLGDLPRDRAP
jgi:fatty-acyl-CoA synthase